jgi:hypothetical protein
VAGSADVVAVLFALKELVYDGAGIFILSHIEALCVAGTHEEDINAVALVIVFYVVEALVVGAAEGEALSSFAVKLVAFPYIFRCSCGIVGVNGNIVPQQAKAA